jgi:sugar phosphate isomerase/epimerase
LASDLRVTGFQALRDFEGLSGPMLAFKIDVTKSMLEMCQAVGCQLLVVNASTLPQAHSDTKSLVQGLRQLAMLAIPMNIRVAYKAAACAHTIKELPQAWDLICSADMPNLGLALDSVEMLLSGTPVDDLEMLDPEKIFLVDLADNMGHFNPHLHVFPGEGEHNESVAAIVTGLHNLGYRGSYKLAVFNSDYLQMPVHQIAQLALRSAIWLGQDVLQRSVPLPNQIRLKRIQGA